MQFKTLATLSLAAAVAHAQTAGGGASATTPSASISYPSETGPSGTPYSPPASSTPSASPSVTTVTTVVDFYTTVCPAPTTFTFNKKTYTVTKSTTITFECPCTVVTVRLSSFPLPPSTIFLLLTNFQSRPSPALLAPLLLPLRLPARHPLLRRPVLLLRLRARLLPHLPLRRRPRARSWSLAPRAPRSRSSLR